MTCRCNVHSNRAGLPRNSFTYAVSLSFVFRKSFH
jgi:hypothetical protein